MPTRRLPSRHLSAILLACALPVCVWLLPRPADASQGEASVWLGSGLANANSVSDGPTLGLAAETGLRVGITDFWSLDLGVEGAYHFGYDLEDDGRVDSMFVQHIFAGFRYNLDIFVYVPYVGFTVDTFLRAPPVEPQAQQGPAIGASLNLGVDWRFARHWSAGVRAEMHLLDTELFDFPAYSTFGLNIGYHFRL